MVRSSKPRSPFPGGAADHPGSISRDRGKSSKSIKLLFGFKKLSDDGGGRPARATGGGVDKGPERLGADNDVGKSLDLYWHADAVGWWRLHRLIGQPGYFVGA